MSECVTHHHACDCREAKFAKLEADLAAAQRELSAWRKAVDEMDNRYPNEWCSTSEVMTNRVAELLAQEGVK